MNHNEMFRVGIIGGTGYTGVELMRLLAQHPNISEMLVASRNEAGKAIADVFPSLRTAVPTRFIDPRAPESFAECAVVFFATPHKVAMHEAPALLASGIRVIDLSADFRIADIPLWEKWYGAKHSAPELAKEAVYGLPEINREKIRSARLVANPGCYATAVQLGLLPLIEAGCVDVRYLVADTKSGVSGYGRKADLAVHFCETADNFHAYAASGHRHQPEITHQLSKKSSTPINLVFVPHLVPMNRGIHATLYARKLNDFDPQELFFKRYIQEYFIDVMPQGSHPDTRSVRASNTCRIALHNPADSDMLVVLSVIDNLTKGAAGQAVQNMNLMLGLNECLGLVQIPVSP